MRISCSRTNFSNNSTYKVLEKDYYVEVESGNRKILLVDSFHDDVHYDNTSNLYSNKDLP